jgi:hypothetical protein
MPVVDRGTSEPVAPSGKAGDDAEAKARGREALAVLVLLALGTALRLLLAVLNDASNDDHWQVVQLLLDGHRGLTMKDCRECFHPKLYYAILAGLARLTGVTTRFYQLRLGQLLDAGAGVLTLWLVHRFLLRFRMARAVRIVVFALAALNPALLAINIQLTNDSVAILGSAGGIYWVSRFLDERRLRHLGYGGVCLGLGIASKGTVWIAGIAAVLALLVAGFSRPAASGARAWRRWLLAPMLALGLLSSVAVAGYDFKSYGTYAALGGNAKLHFLAPTRVGRPGVVSVYDSYLTFKLLDLVRFPYTTAGFPIVPAHRSSVFSQLYGRLHFLHLDSWPAAWRLRSQTYYPVGRLNLLLGLVPSGLFLLGLGLNLGRQAVALRRGGPLRWFQEGDGPPLLCLLLCLGYLGFIVLFTKSHRDFSAMKPIYLFPGILGFVKVLADGYQFLATRWAARPRLRAAVWSASGLLVAGYLADVLVLVGQMAARNGADIALHLGLG